MNRERTDRLIGNTCPAGVKGSGAHIVCAGDNRRREQKRVLERDAAELRT